jgi:cellulose synthase/poly-beta-1,6-N-acetylglucosamine synthase-like glycosyltransferase
VTGTVLTAALALAAAAVLLPATVLFLECTLAALVPLVPLVPRARAATGPRPSVAVLVPAHDEESVIGATVARLLGELRGADRLVVVADNCKDATAAAARAAGATVVERSDPQRRGKGYALECGVQFLEAAPPEVVIVVDADCTLAPGSVDALSRRAAEGGRPAQARDVVLLPSDPRPLDSVSAFAFLVKNVVRPTGLARLGLPCGLMGTGMAFPWAVLRAAHLGTSALVEDMQLGLDLVLAGHPPRFCPEALVTSPLPSHRDARETQRRRWEHGHLATVLGTAPRMLAAGVRRLDPAILGLAIDVCVPPLSLLVLSSLAVLAASLGAGALGLASWLPAAVAGAALGLVVVAVVAAWLRYGRRDYPASVLLRAPLYSLGKIPLYLGFVGRRQQAWVRTAREPQRDPAAPPEGQGPDAQP